MKSIEFSLTRMDSIEVNIVTITEKAATAIDTAESAAGRIVTLEEKMMIMEGQ